MAVSLHMLLPRVRWFGTARFHAMLRLGSGLAHIDERLSQSPGGMGLTSCFRSPARESSGPPHALPQRLRLVFRVEAGAPCLVSKKGLQPSASRAISASLMMTAHILP